MFSDIEQFVDLSLVHFNKKIFTTNGILLVKVKNKKGDRNALRDTIIWEKSRTKVHNS
jgi:hypothetical protein